MVYDLRILVLSAGICDAKNACNGWKVQWYLMKSELIFHWKWKYFVSEFIVKNCDLFSPAVEQYCTGKSLLLSWCCLLWWFQWANSFHLPAGSVMITALQTYEFIKIWPYEHFFINTLMCKDILIQESSLQYFRSVKNIHLVDHQLQKC